MRRLGMLALGLLLASCGEGVGPGEEFLTGHPQWEWISACCGIAGNELTPATEGYVYVLAFTRRGRVRATRNDVLLLETGYRVRTSRPGGGEDELTMVTYDEPLPLGPGIHPAPRHLLTVLPGGGLLLRNQAPCADCFGDWTFLPRLTGDLAHP
jgi:hypothetical protein